MITLVLVSNSHSVGSKAENDIIDPNSYSPFLFFSSLASIPGAPRAKRRSAENLVERGIGKLELSRMDGIGGGEESQLPTMIAT